MGRRSGGLTRLWKLPKLPVRLSLCALLQSLQRFLFGLVLQKKGGLGQERYLRTCKQSAIHAKK
jgi:hypothetical protein